MFKNLSKEKIAVALAAVATLLVTNFLPDLPNIGPCNFFFGEPEYPSED